jgi:hypothetical protein
MSTPGLRKAALFLSVLSPADRRAMLARLPAATGRSLRPLIDELVRRGWNARAAVEQVLAEELRGLTADTTLGIEALLELSRRLPPGWYARVVAAAGPIDHEFLLALLEADYARRVREALRAQPALPPALAGAVLAEAMALGGSGGTACAA